ncbi:MAG: site-specific DNA-methyltransferase [Alphaproteobacteria bacterium]|nr:site-specific DNA-methyltransferase [Alphaproteobacteria bacterium]MDA8005908.1 site-specific DNA-methyltransferase [Alphaproteobacteria bacterium]MDA8012405.1 site-specific DNA-methyltransferase [Alphaproteobacteria bacterium]
MTKQKTTKRGSIEAVGEDLASLDIAREKRRRLRALYPEVFGDGKIDFEQLRRVLGDQVESGVERFGLNWPGKAECMRILQQPSVATLKPVREESVNFDGTGNLFIEGENLEVLKLLQKSYFEMVKVIYIDPPYNTGREFVYPDKYASGLSRYLAYTRQIDAEGHRFATNTDTIGRYHSNWLSMMYPRLYLARNLLREDGVIFISIDDNEVHRLRSVMDDIFGEENFLAQIAWQGMDTVKNDAKHFSTNCEFVLCYSKNKDLCRIKGQKRTQHHDRVYKNPDNDPRGPYLLTPLHAKSGKASTRYKYTFSNGVTWEPPTGTYPRFSQETLKELDGDDRIYFGEKPGSVPQRKTFLKDVGSYTKLTTFWSYQFAGSTRQSNSELSHILGPGAFQNPKPVKLIKLILDSVSEQNDIILDSFAGSGTTAHAVLALNKEDGGNRKFIMVQLPEDIEESSEAYKAGYKTVADIGKDRIRRAAAKIKEESDDHLSLTSGAGIDLGFKVFALAPSNFRVWDGNLDETGNLEDQLLAHIDHIRAASTPEDILYELLLKAGFPLTAPIKKTALAGKEVFSVEDGEMLLCLEKELNQEVIDAMAKAAPRRVVCLDEGFKGNDQLKTNAAQTFKSREEDGIVFTTV